MVFKNSLNLFLLFSTIACFSQKEYSFHYFIHYEYTKYIDVATTKSTDIYYVTNSEQNTYYAVATEADSLNFKIYLKGEDGIEARIPIPKKNLLESEDTQIEIPCASVFKYEENVRKYLMKVYAFSEKKDTLLDTKKYSSISLFCTNPKRYANRSIGSYQYIMEDSSSFFHLPILTSSLALKKWEEDKKLPNTIYKEKIYTNNLGQLEFKETLKSVRKVNLKVTISEECDLSKRAIHTKGYELSDE